MLPVLCAAAALAAAISTVRADGSSSSPGSSSGSAAADDTGMGNAYEYPQGSTPSQNSPEVSSKGLTETKPGAQPSIKPHQRAGTAADACHIPKNPTSDHSAAQLPSKSRDQCKEKQVLD